MSEHVKFMSVLNGEDINMFTLSFAKSSILTHLGMFCKWQSEHVHGSLKWMAKVSTCLKFTTWEICRKKGEIDVFAQKVPKYCTRWSGAKTHTHTHAHAQVWECQRKTKSSQIVKRWVSVWVSGVGRWSGIGKQMTWRWRRRRRFGCR